MRWATLAFLAFLAAACGGPEPTTAPQARERPAPRPGAPNVLLVVIDTLRGDAILPEDAARAAMPGLSRLAAGAVWAAQASSPSSWTIPSITSLLTGVLPERHEALDGTRSPRDLGDLVTWADTMRDVLGYETALHCAGFPGSMLTPLSQGFDETSDAFRLGRGHGPVASWIRSRGARPWFLMLHTFDAHDPYGEANHPLEPVRPTEAALRALRKLGPNPPPEELVRRSYLHADQQLLLRTRPDMLDMNSAVTRHIWNGLQDGAASPLALELASAYREGLRWVDGTLTSMLAGLEAQGLLENTLLVVTADHGEAFGEHGMLAHGRQLYDELLRIPLVMRGPAPFDRPRRLDGSVGLIDLFPTVVDWLGAPVPPGLHGTSFLDDLEGDGPDHPVVAQLERTRVHTDGLSVAQLGSVRSRSWKYIGTLDHTAGTLREEAYDLRSDPQERHDLAAGNGEVRGLPFDAEFCRHVEDVRDWLWDRARYPGPRGEPPVSSRRPEPACEERR